MKLITKPQREQLIANFHKIDAGRQTPDEYDVMPVVRIVTNYGKTTVLLTEIDPDYPHHGYGLCHFGGEPAYDFVDLEELSEPVDLKAHPLAIVFKRDRLWVPVKTLPEYLADARKAGRIVF
ncbi:DUF2958 domain-containing protein [Rhodobacterales bacterium HKCCE4037]|nr:DUF2958 domain-containing protein [Rhodobacterales bacterium HKCCE4037]